MISFYNLDCLLTIVWCSFHFHQFFAKCCIYNAWYLFLTNFFISSYIFLYDFLVLKYFLTVCPERYYPLCWSCLFPELNVWWSNWVVKCFVKKSTVLSWPCNWWLGKHFHAHCYDFSNENTYSRRRLSAIFVQLKRGWF